MRYSKKAAKGLRLARGLRVEDVAHKASLSAQGLRAIERGAVPSAKTLGKLALALGVSVSAFFWKPVPRREGP